MAGTKTLDNRIAEQTSDSVNRQIAQKTEESVAYHANHPEEISGRLAALEHEWDIERALITNASIIGGLGLLLSIVVKRPWLLLTAIVLGFLLQHGLQGWCPPLPVFRRLGVRTKEEILREWYALRALRGELSELCEAPATVPQQRAQQILEAINE